MSVTFSGEEIVEMAIRTEDTGYDFYKEAAGNSGNEKLKELFEYLAEEELKHRKAYAGLKDVIDEKALGTPIDWNEVGEYIQAMTDSSFFLGSDKNINLASRASTDAEAVEFAIGFEKDTLLFFYHIRDLVREANRPVVDRIIAEEKIHIQKLTAIKNKLK
jgi:rubrerythrin